MNFIDTCCHEEIISCTSICTRMTEAEQAMLVGRWVCALQIGIHFFFFQTH